MGKLAVRTRRHHSPQPRIDLVARRCSGDESGRQKVIRGTPTVGAGLDNLCGAPRLPEGYEALGYVLVPQNQPGPLRRFRRWLVPLLALLALALPGGASAQQYVLKHPRHEHCRVHYVRRVETVKHRRETFCVHVAPKPESAPAPAPVSESAPTPFVPAPAPLIPTTPKAEPAATTTQGSTHVIADHGDVVWSVTATVSAVGPLVVPIQYKVIDTTTGAVEADVTLPWPAECVIVDSYESPSTYTGTAAFGGEDSALALARCGFGSFTVPESDSIEVVPSFAGEPGYLPSTGAALAI